MASLADLREEYARHTLDLVDTASDPFVQFEHWFAEVLEAQLPMPNAMTLATADRSGQPFTRVVLLKGLEQGKFIFYTNYQSHKGLQLAENPKVALSFFWLELQRQVIIRGLAEPVDAATSDAYFATRPRGSQLSAWASAQSQPLVNRAELEAQAARTEQLYEGQQVPRPPHWGGYAVTPQSIEFWQGRTSRLHDRIVYSQTSERGWERQRLAP